MCKRVPFGTVSTFLEKLLLYADNSVQKPGLTLLGSSTFSNTTIINSECVHLASSASMYSKLNDTVISRLFVYFFSSLSPPLGPTKKLARDDVLGEILDDDQETEEVLASKLGASPPRRISIRLTRLQNVVFNKSSTEEKNPSIQPLQSPNKPNHSACDNTSTRSV